MSRDITIARVKGEVNVENFIPSTIEEIRDFNPQVNERYEIEVVDFCPFTYITDTNKFVANVENEYIIQGSSFEKYFTFVDNYNQDSTCIFEDAKIIKKLT